MPESKPLAQNILGSWAGPGLNFFDIHGLGLSPNFHRSLMGLDWTGPVPMINGSGRAKLTDRPEKNSTTRAKWSFSSLRKPYFLLTSSKSFLSNWNLSTRTSLIKSQETLSTKNNAGPQRLSKS